MTTHFAFGNLGHIAHNGSDVPEMLAAGSVQEALTASGTNQATTVTAPVYGGSPKVGVRVATDAAVNVAFGAAPNALTTPQFFCPANSVSYFVVEPGDKAAAVTVG